MGSVCHKQVFLRELLLCLKRKSSNLTYGVRAQLLHTVQISGDVREDDLIVVVEDGEMQVLI